MPQLVHLEQCFPKLVSAGYEKTSDATADYNCIAWAAHDSHRWWWPGPDTYWPGWAKREPTVASFAQAFRRLGYRKCSHSRLEIGYEKIVLYAMHSSGIPIPEKMVIDHFENWEPKHMARQLSDGTWTSKAGSREDFTHFTLDAIECFGSQTAQYGLPIFYMRRLVIVSWIVRLMQVAQWHFVDRWNY
jgi:hypothetical protein